MFSMLSSNQPIAQPCQTEHFGRLISTLRSILGLVSVLTCCGCSGDAKSYSLDTRATTIGEALNETFDSRAIGNSFESPPKISHLKACDLDGDGSNEIIVCDCENASVSVLVRQQDGAIVEQLIGEELPAPAHADAADLDGDGDLDVVVAVLGVLFPNNDKIGQVVALENLGDLKFRKRVLLSEVARVSDVRAADMNGDKQVDLVVTQFGYHEGELRWMRNSGDWQFESTILQSLAGGIHGEVADMNGDGALDISLLVSQEFESIYIFYGDGKGGFQESIVFEAKDPDFGSSGLWTHDLNGDGRIDLLYTNGDAFDYSPPHPWPWHGLQWLENEGDGSFTFHRLADFGGAVSCHPLDYDQDGDDDLLLDSTFNQWDDPGAQSLLMLENMGDGNFTQHDLTNSPSHIQAIEVVDWNADGRPEFVTGGMHVSKPYDRVQRLVLWE